jgi:fibronectin-binding autotransporter adhesin
MGATVSISASHVYSNTASRDRDGSGGGLAFEDSTVTLVNNLIRGNTGYSGSSGDMNIGVGGGLSIADSAFNIVGNQFVSNTALISGGYGYEFSLAVGGGVAILNSSGQLANNLIDGNVAAGGGNGNGGGIYFETYRDRDDWVTIRGNVVQNNVAASGDGGAYGGGICIFTTAQSAIADVRLSDNVLQGNSAAVTGLGVGGGLVVLAQNTSSMTLAFRNNLVLSNTTTLSGSDGGVGGGVGIGNVRADFQHNRFVANRAGSASAVYFFASHVEQQADILRGNLAGGFFDSYYEDPGSGVVFEASDATASSLAVIDNRTTNTGTAIFVRSSDIRLVHPTLARNTGGSGIHVEKSTRSQVAMTNALLVSHTVGITVGVGNTATLDAVLWYSNTLNVGGAGHIAVTRAYTGHPAFDADGYHLTAASAAIDAGVFAGVGTDIDGDTRPDGCFPDLGADEFITGADCRRIYLPIVVRQSP